MTQPHRRHRQRRGVAGPRLPACGSTRRRAWAGKRRV